MLLRHSLYITENELDTVQSHISLPKMWSVFGSLLKPKIQEIVQEVFYPLSSFDFEIAT